jgi:hypothetical protein
MVRQVAYACHLSLSLSLALALSRAPSCSRSRSLSLSLARALSRARSLSRALSLARALSRSVPIPPPPVPMPPLSTFSSSLPRAPFSSFRPRPPPHPPSPHQRDSRMRPPKKKRITRNPQRASLKRPHLRRAAACDVANLPHAHLLKRNPNPSALTPKPYISEGSEARHISGGT